MVENIHRDPTFSQVLERLQTTTTRLLFIPNLDYLIRVSEDFDMVEVVRRKRIPQIRVTSSGLQIPFHNNNRVTEFLKDDKYESFRNSLNGIMNGNNVLIRPSSEPRWIFEADQLNPETLVIQAVKHLQPKKSAQFKPEDMLGVLSLSLA